MYVDVPGEVIIVATQAGQLHMWWWWWAVTDRSKLCHQEADDSTANITPQQNTVDKHVMGICLVE